MLISRKKITALFVAVIISISCLFCYGFATSVKGDIDGDGKVSASDARLALRHSVGLEKLSTSQKKVADLNGDGNVTAADARLILRLAVGLSDDTGTTEESTTKKTEESTTKKTKTIAYYEVEIQGSMEVCYGYNYLPEGKQYYIYYTDGTKEGPFTKPYPEGCEPSSYDTSKCLYCGKNVLNVNGHYACAYGGCCRFLCDMKCPECGVLVKANTCHTCK